MRTTFVLVLCLVAVSSITPTHVQAQEFRLGQFQGGLHFMLAFPQGEFEENTDQVGVGLNLDLGYVIPDMPVVAGAAFGFATYGSETFNVPFSSTVQLVNVDLTTSNNLAIGHLFLRVQPQSGIFRPYFEGLLGFNYLWTESSVEDERYEDSQIAGSTNLDDFAFSYGAGGGLMFRVYRGETEQPGQGIEVLVDLKARYLYGGEAKYFDKESITEDENGAPVLLEENALQSETDMLNFSIGVVVRI
ncbi:MAG: hypothetical protein RRA94_02930 [Bacteroidota bacterium]|nr:hypothetical protein [Bacteroidota bacterium]